MNKWKALAAALLVVTVSGLIFGLVYLSKPAPALSYSSYTWKPGCHCGKPTTTTVKKTTTTVKKTTATTVKKTTPTTQKATTTATTAKKASTKTSTTKAATKRSASTAAATKSAKSTKTTKGSSTTTSDRTGAGDGSDSGTLGAALATYYDEGDGGSSGGAGGSADDSSDLSGLTAGEEVAAMSVQPPHYYLSPVAIGFLLVYLVSFALYRTKRMKVTTHRKIWNMLLLGTFLMCGILGLVLTVGVTRSTPMQLPTWLLVWHVETGIAMCIISIFHIGWHARYYMAIATGKRRPARPAKADKAERGPAREGEMRKQRAPRPALGHSGMSRSEEERRLAYERRMAARGRYSPAS